MSYGFISRISISAEPDWGVFRLCQRLSSQTETQFFLCFFFFQNVIFTKNSMKSNFCQGKV